MPFSGTRKYGKPSLILNLCTASVTGMLPECVWREKAPQVGSSNPPAALCVSSEPSVLNYQGLVSAMTYDDSVVGVSVAEPASPAVPIVWVSSTYLV
ncbi:hypothetical protein SMNI109538_07305 [Smaragdicoccus niigatensis]